MKPDTEAEPEVQVTRWLVEAGRRRRPPGRRQPAAGCAARHAAPPQRPKQAGFHRLALLGLLAAAYLQYTFLDALLQAVSLRSLIVFALGGAHG